MMRRWGATLAVLMTLVACATGDRFETLMSYSREGRDAQTLALAQQILDDPSEPALVRARTEMTVSLVHIRAKHWAEAREALDRSKALGIETDTGYFKEHLAEYEGWIADGR